MSQATVEVPPVHPGDIDSIEDSLPPQSHLPQPNDEWLQQIGNVSQSSTPAGSAGGSSREQSRSKASRKPRIPLKYQAAGALVGIAVIAFLQFSKDPSAVTDMLGTELVKLVPESVPISRPAQPAVDPRLADPVALDMLQLERGPETTAAAHVPGPGQTEQFNGLPDLADAEGEVLGEAASAAQEVATDTVTTSSPAPGTGATAVSAPAAPSVSNEELMQRLQLLEGLVTQLVQQQQKAAAKATTAPAAAPSAEKAAATEPATPVAQPRRTARPANVAKAPAAKPAKQAKTSAPAAQPAPALGGQLVSVDMWNGEASVVITSGLPGDRRVRVLRPGDVVNGMALRSADPVTRSATFVAPGSQGLTLYVSQGG